MRDLIFHVTFKMGFIVKCELPGLVSSSLVNHKWFLCIIYLLHLYRICWNPSIHHMNEMWDKVKIKMHKLLFSFMELENYGWLWSAFSLCHFHILSDENLMNLQNLHHKFHVKWINFHHLCHKHHVKIQISTIIVTNVM